MQASQFSLEIVIVTLHLFRCCSTINFLRSSKLSLERPLCCLAYHFHLSLFSFQGAKRHRKLRIIRFHPRVKPHSLRCVSFSSRTHFIGLRSDGDGGRVPGFDPRSQSSISLSSEIQSQIGFGGPEWARTTDLTIISRTL